MSRNPHWSTSAYNDFTLNATGISNVSKTGVSKFGLRNPEYDVANSAPANPGGAVQNTLVCHYDADRTGTTNDPKLTVVHSEPVESILGTIQNINYIYDNVGNVTNIADYSTSTGKIIDYTYDDLYRLTNATTSAASSTSYAHSYTYNAIGNITISHFEKA